MKKAAMIAGAAVLFLSASVHAQTDTTTARTMDSSRTPANGDKYNNWSPDTYKMQPMPESLTQDKVFPAVGRYDVTDKEGTQSSLTVTLDETNKGMVWVDGLPQGRIKAILRKSPSTYKIPSQTIGDDATAKDAKKIPEGVMIYDKDANLLNVCVGCTFNAEDPAVAFNPDAKPMEDASTETTTKKTQKKTKTTTKTKVAKAKPIHYSGTKVIEQTAVTPAPAPAM